MRAGEVFGLRWKNLDRHTFASTLLRRGWSLPYIQKQGGWTDATTVLKHYGRWIPQEAPAQIQPAATPVQPHA
jgi:integrase